MQGKTVLITGTTSGIGKATAIRLAQMGATVALANRPGPRAVSAAEAIGEAVDGGEVVRFDVDLSSQADVRNLAASVTARLPRVDVVIHNAGVYEAERRLSVDGIEMTWAVNVLTPFLLTTLLRDRLVESAPARVVIVASVGHKYAKGLRWDDLQFEDGYVALDVYNQSKLAAVMLTYELALRLDETGVTVNCLHPGSVRTELIRAPLEIAWYWRLVKALATPFTLTPERGAETSVYLAASPDVKGVSGRYFVKKRPRRSNPASYDFMSARRLWDVCEEMTLRSAPPSSGPSAL